MSFRVGELVQMTDIKRYLSPLRSRLRGKKSLGKGEYALAEL